MKTLIIYATKYGTTADCAALLKNKLSGEVTIADINKTNPLLKGYDQIIIGGSVYIGKTAKKLRNFCTANAGELRNKKLGLFLCCALTDQAEQVFADSFPAELLKAAKAKGIFGSEARLDKMGFLDKTIIKAVTKGDFSNFKISHENIERFAKQMDNKI